jgi:uncharacterized protein YegL
MADITTKNKIGIKPGGLHARIAEKELYDQVVPPEVKEIDVNSLPNRIAIMIDCSGYMYGESISLLEKAIQDFIQKANMTDTAIAVESFPEQVRVPLTNDKTQLWFLTMGLKADGGTPMLEAMQYCLNSYKMTRAILISDGQPNSEPHDQTQYFKEREISIDTLHIGNSSRGEDCLKRISDITGGLFVKFKDVKQFATAFAFLLPETRANASMLLLGSGANEVR